MKKNNGETLLVIRNTNTPIDMGTQFDPDVPSREAILAFMREYKKQIRLDALARHFALSRDTGIQGLEKRLTAMLRDGQLIQVRQGYKINDQNEAVVIGKVQGHRDGFGFLIPIEEGEDIFLPNREMLKVLHGDTVSVKITDKDERGRLVGTILEIIERGTTRLVGRILYEQGQWLVVPEDQRIKHDIIIPVAETLSAEHGQVVVIDITQQPTRYSQPMGKVIEVLGEIDDPGMEIEIAIRKFDIPAEFSKAALQQADKLPDHVKPSDLKGRIDLRDIPFITIDGEDARDFDDAVYAEAINLGTEKRKRKGWRLLVAIADVSHYVKAQDSLDKDALLRGTSVYFPRRVIPMLPEALSNGLCSLNPAVDRLVLVCDMVIPATGAKAGTVQAYQFYNAVIHSHARTTYTQVWDSLQQAEGPTAKKLKAVLPHIHDLYQLYQLLFDARKQRGAMEFETVETKIISNDMGKIEQIVPAIRNDAHRLIEECMLAANTCAADFILRHKRLGLFRVHEGPTVEKLASLRDFLKQLGLQLAGGTEPQGKDYAELLESARVRPDYQVVQTMALRSMQQAIYSPDNVGHFGLAYEAYTHFTSPIRRYPDLLIHRIIKAILSEQKYTPTIDGVERIKGEPLKAYEHAVWERLGLQLSATERRADEASRDVEAWLKCWYVRERIGEVFSGKVTGVTSFGLFVTLDTLFVEGLIHISELGSDYFVFSETNHELCGQRTGIRYRLGDTVHIQVARVDLEARRIDFIPVKGLNYTSVQKELNTSQREVSRQVKKAAKPKPHALKGQTARQRRAAAKRETKKVNKRVSASKKSNRKKR
ncbi:ribonuclease R [Pelistega sp. NLN82]|uniref:Ribonuclease R n=1 Tax=Pelistega ratti TaxID=2652177 RepID=A0A6L9Y963_9BURK|nr:ribonuclease R [Pelistega ratti]NEN76264.1 ribonuclease R [Pelistega ratti]